MRGPRFDPGGRQLLPGSACCRRCTAALGRGFGGAVEAGCFDLAWLKAACTDALVCPPSNCDAPCLMARTPTPPNQTPPLLSSILLLHLFHPLRHIHRCCCHEHATQPHKDSLKHRGLRRPQACCATPLPQLAGCLPTATLRHHGPCVRRAAAL